MMQRKYWNRSFALFTSVMLLVGVLFAENAHHVSYATMKVDARALGMGGAYTGAAEGVAATYYNPAGLALMEGVEVNSMISTDLAFDRSYNFAGVGSELGIGAFAISWISAKTGGFPRYDGAQNYLGQFDVKENNVMFSYGGYYEKLDIYGGATLKIYSSSIDGDNEKSGYGLDIGGLYQIDDMIQVGVAVKDLYTEIDSETIEPMFNVGIAARLNDHFMSTLDAGYNLGVESEINYAGGIEYVLNYRDIVKVAPRIGLSGSDVHFGLGVNVDFVTVNYAFIPKPNDDFHDSNRFSVIVRF